MDNYELANSSESQSNQNIPSKLVEVPVQIDNNANMIKKSTFNADSSALSMGVQDPSTLRCEKVVVGGGAGSSVVEDSLIHSESILETRADDINECLDLTLGDDDVNNMESLEYSSMDLVTDRQTDKDLQDSI